MSYSCVVIKHLHVVGLVGALISKCHRRFHHMSYAETDMIYPRYSLEEFLANKYLIRQQVGATKEDVAELYNYNYDCKNEINEDYIHAILFVCPLHKVYENPRSNENGSREVKQIKKATDAARALANRLNSLRHYFVVRDDLARVKLYSTRELNSQATFFYLRQNMSKCDFSEVLETVQECIPSWPKPYDQVAKTTPDDRDVEELNYVLKTILHRPQLKSRSLEASYQDALACSKLKVQHSKLCTNFTVLVCPPIILRYFVIRLLRYDETFWSRLAPPRPGSISLLLVNGRGEAKMPFYGHVYDRI